MRSLNNHQLRRYLMKEIHNVEISRKPPKKAASQGRGPARNWRYRQWVRSLPCAGCGVEPAGEAAHTGSDGGMAQKASDYSCVPLCTNCHTQSADAYHRIGKAAFESCRNVKFAELVKRLNRTWFHPQARIVG
jgi:hypothetical protein